MCGCPWMSWMSPLMAPSLTPAGLARWDLLALPRIIAGQLSFLIAFLTTGKLAVKQFISQTVFVPSTAYLGTIGTSKAPSEQHFETRLFCWMGDAPHPGLRVDNLSARRTQRGAPARSTYVDEVGLTA